MNDLNLLMSRIDEINHKLISDITADDIDALITYHRHNRSRKASGEKPARPKIDLDAIMGSATKPKSTTGFKVRI